MLKRVFDFLLAFVLIVISFPVMLCIALLIYFTMGMPIFFKQQRPGYREKIFTILKFRTMQNTKDENGELLPDDQRLIGFGKLLRSLSLDELPQLFNVLKGDMSFVGPRPLLIEYLGKYNEEQKKRHNVRPGITGWAQVNGRNAISWQQKFEYDVWYIENCSVALDIKIIFLTIKKVLKSEGINQEGQVTTDKFKGN